MAASIGPHSDRPRRFSAHRPHLAALYANNATTSVQWISRGASLPAADDPGPRNPFSREPPSAACSALLANESVVPKQVHNPLDETVGCIGVAGCRNSSRGVNLLSSHGVRGGGEEEFQDRVPEQLLAPLRLVAGGHHRFGSLDDKTRRVASLVPASADAVSGTPDKGRYEAIARDTESPSSGASRGP